MKKIIYFVFAALALVACEPNNGATEKVRIGVSLDDKTQPYKGQQRISAIDGAKEIVITWEEDDVLYWDKGDGIDTENPFKIISGVGEQQAFFECDAMIDSNDEFTLYYHGATTPIPQEQFVTIYEDGKSHINNDYLMYTAKNCKVGKAVYLEPNYALLGIKLTGTDKLTTDLNTKNFYIIVADKDWQNESKQDVWEDSYIVKLYKKDGEKTDIGVDLKNTSIVYYLTLPVDYILSDKAVWLTTSWGHPISTKLDLEKLTLKAGTAQVIAINVEDNPGNQSWDDYKLVKATY